MNDHFLQRLHPAFRRTRAQSLVEMALVLPILVMLLTGVFEFGMILYAHVQVANAVREGARAASLYRSTRYATMDNKINITCDTNANGDINGWSLDQAVRQAIAYRPLVTSGGTAGCPKTSATTFNYTSLGWLDPAPSPDMWQVDIINVEDTTFWPTVQEKDDVMPAAGTRATVRLRYPYRLLIISNILPFLQDPIWISKSVQVEFQN